MITPDVLKEIRKRLQNVTQGQWLLDRGDEETMASIFKVQDHDPCGTDVIADEMLYRDANFLFHARTDITRLLDEVDRLSLDLVSEIGFHEQTKKERNELIDEVERLRKVLSDIIKAQSFEFSPNVIDEIFNIANQALEHE